MKIQFLAIFVAAFMLAGCDSNIDTVKKASIQQNKSMTVGAALDTWSECAKVTWEDTSTDARKSVTANCEVKAEILKAEFDEVNGEYQKAMEKAKTDLEAAIDRSVNHVTSQFPALKKDDVIAIAKLACKYEPGNFISASNCDEDMITKELESKHNIKKNNTWEHYSGYFSGVASQINREAKPMWLSKLPKEIKQKNYIFEFVINTDKSVDINKAKMIIDGEEEEIGTHFLAKAYKR